MATKKTSSSKVKSKGKEEKVKPKASPKAPSKVAKAEVTQKASAAKAAPARPEPKMMSGRTSKDTEPAPKSAKAPKAAPVADVDKADPEWVQLMNQNKSAKPVPYVMSENYEAKAIISHKVLGLGFVLKNQNNRIEVQFKDGKKTLITNYKKA